MTELIDLTKLSDAELISFYAYWILELKRRGIVRTNNIVGDIGEFLAIKTYNETKRLPKLMRTGVSTKGVDAISNKGERYNIKTVTTNTTSAFRDISTYENRIFEKLIIVELDKKFMLKRVMEVSWDTFFKYKKWHSTMEAYDITITKKLIAEAKIIYSNENV